MSRRPPNPVADRAAQNQQTLKSLVKLEGNKSCADCKRNKRKTWLTVANLTGLTYLTIQYRSKMGQLEPWSVYLHTVLYFLKCVMQVVEEAFLD